MVCVCVCVFPTLHILSTANLKHNQALCFCCVILFLTFITNSRKAVEIVHTGLRYYKVWENIPMQDAYSRMFLTECSLFALCSLLFHPTPPFLPPSLPPPPLPHRRSEADETTERQGEWTVFVLARVVTDLTLSCAGEQETGSGVRDRLFDLEKASIAHLGYIGRGPKWNPI